MSHDYDCGDELMALPTCPHGIHDGAPAPGHNGLCRHCISAHSRRAGRAAHAAEDFRAGFAWALDNRATFDECADAAALYATALGQKLEAA